MTCPLSLQPSAAYPCAARKLVNLPIDVILEVFYMLGADDVVSLRCTCKLLRDISQCRSVWLNLFNHQASRTPILERPLSSITTACLQERVLKKDRLEKNLTSPCPKARLKAAIYNVMRRIPVFFELIPGGRWLLTMSELGSVTAWDLDRPTPSEVIISLPLGDHSVQHPAICINAKADYLSIDLAVIVASQDREKRRTRVKIWRIVLDPSLGTEGSLLGSEISDFIVMDDIQYASLRGNLFAYLSQTTDVWQAQFDVVVFQWSEGAPVSRKLRMKVDNPDRDPKPVGFQLISQSQLLVVTRRSAVLFNLAEVPVDGAGTCTPAWTYRFTPLLTDSYLSNPDPYPNPSGQRSGTWVSIYGGRDIYRLFISGCASSMSQGYHLNASVPSPFRSATILGHRWGLSLPDQTRRDTYTLYQFPSDASLQELKVDLTRPIDRTIQLNIENPHLWTAGPIAFDEETGRLCMLVDPSGLRGGTSPPTGLDYERWVVHVVDLI